MIRKFLKRVVISLIIVNLLTMPITSRILGVKAYAMENRPLIMQSYKRASNELGNLRFTKTISPANSLEVKCDKNSPQEINKNMRFYVDRKEDMTYKFSIEDESGIRVLKDFSNDNFVDLNLSSPKKFKILVSGKDINNLSDVWLGYMEFEVIHEPLIINESNLSFTSNLVYNNNPKTLVFHHIEASKMSVNSIHDYHIDKGWSGIGYHYFVDKEGNIFKGRPENAVGAHCPPKNFSSISIAVEGTYMTETMPDKQKKAVVKLSKDILKRCDINTIGGHGDFYKTDCPGTNFPLQELKSLILENN